jgi:hypothetical protein
MVLRRKGAHRLGRLTGDQYNWLVYGFAEKWAGAFVDQEDYLDAWMRHREELLEGRAPGRKPLAWWIIEARLPYPGLDQERQFLYERKLLPKAERAALLADWRYAFDKGRKWSDVPETLWTKWENEKAAASPVSP